MGPSIDGPGSDPTSGRYTAIDNSVTHLATALTDPGIDDTIAVTHFGTDAPAWLALTPTSLRTGRARIGKALQPPANNLGFTNIPGAIERCGTLLGGETKNRQRIVFVATDGEPEMPNNPQMASWATVEGTIRFLGNSKVFVLGPDGGDPTIQQRWTTAGATFVPIHNLSGPSLQTAIEQILTREAIN